MNGTTIAGYLGEPGEFAPWQTGISSATSPLRIQRLGARLTVGGGGGAEEAIEEAAEVAVGDFCLRSWEILGLDFEEASDDGGGLLPILRLGLKGFAAGFGEVVEASTAIVFRGAPFGFDGAFLFELEKDGIERALVHGEEIAADLLDAAGEAVAVERAEDVESLEDHEGESALEDVGFLLVWCRGHFGNQQEDDMGPLGKQQGRFF